MEKKSSNLNCAPIEDIKIIQNHMNIKKIIFVKW